jgi:CheY-like chemotaxis protein
MEGVPSVVVADDVEAIRALVRATLETEGFAVVAEAGDGHEAVERVRELQPHLVLLDLNMPRFDGLQAITEIRAVSPATKICVLSGLAEEIVADKAYELGAHAFVEKGSALDELPTVLRGLL